MQHLTHRLRRSTAALAVAVTLPVLSGCASNFSSQVLQPYQPSVGVHDRDGAVYAIDFLVVTDGSGSGTLVGGLVNKADAADELVGVRAGGSSQIQVDSAGEELPPETLVQLADTESVSLQGEALTPGAFIDLTLEFAEADPVTFQVPVTEQEGAYADVAVS